MPGDSDLISIHLELYNVKAFNILCLQSSFVVSFKKACRSDNFSISVALGF